MCAADPARSTGEPEVAMGLLSGDGILMPMQHRIFRSHLVDALRAQEIVEHRDAAQ